MPSSSMSAPWRVNVLIDALDDLAEQPPPVVQMSVCVRRGTPARRHAVLDVIDAIEYQTMQMDVEIGRRTKTLNQRDRPGLCITPLESGLCLIRKVEMAREMTCNTGESRCGWAANRTRSGIGKRRVIKGSGRGRNAGHPTPPAQIRTSGITAYGSCLGS